MKDLLRNALRQGKEKFQELKTEALKFKSKEFLDASLAGSALVAMADGTIDSEEKKKMMAFVESNDVLSIYPTADVINCFKGHIEALEFDKDIGEAKAFQAIGKMRTKPEQARLIMRMVIAIGASDGDFDADEKAMAGRIAIELGLQGSEFGLN